MKLFNKKGLTVSLLAILSCGLLVGCRDDERILSDKGYIRAFTDIELRTTAGADTIKVLQNLANRFTEEVEPNVTITVNKYSGDYSGLASDVRNGFSAGTHPDMTMVYPDAVADFIDDGFAYNLEPYMYNEEYGWSEEDFDDLITTYLEEGQYYVVDGTYSLPFSKSTEVMYYNQRILNLTIPNVATADDPNDTIVITPTYLETLTWETFFDELCPSIMAYTETPAGENLINKGGTAGEEWAVLGYDSDDNLFITLAAQYDIPYTHVDTATGQGSFDFVNDEMKAKVLEWHEYAKQNYVLTAGSTGNRANDYFKANQVLFSIGSTAGSRYQWASGMDVRVTRIPQAEGKEQEVILQGPSMAFLSHRNSDGKIDQNRRLASWLFYKYMAEATNSLEWSLSADYFPIRMSSYETDDYKEKYDESNYASTDYEALTSRIANYSSKLTDIYFTSPAFKGSNTSRTQVGGIMTKAINPESTEEQILAQFDSAYEECVKAAR